MRCVEGHGRLSSFFQFLREKEFVRTLTKLEVARLQAHVTQVRCSSCGAPVDLVHDAQCSFCHAPISILDADAVKRTIAELTEQERHRKTADPAAAVDALLAGRRFERKMDRIEGRDMVDTGRRLSFPMTDARPWADKMKTCGPAAEDPRIRMRLDAKTPPKPFVGTTWRVLLELPVSGEQPRARRRRMEASADTTG